MALENGTGCKLWAFWSIEANKSSEFSWVEVVSTNCKKFNNLSSISEKCWPIIWEACLWSMPFWSLISLNTGNSIKRTNKPVSTKIKVQNKVVLPCTLSHTHCGNKIKQSNTHKQDSPTKQFVGVVLSSESFQFLKNKLGRMQLYLVLRPLKVQFIPILIQLKLKP